MKKNKIIIVFILAMSFFGIYKSAFAEVIDIENRGHALTEKVYFTLPEGWVKTQTFANGSYNFYTNKERKSGLSVGITVHEGWEGLALITAMQRAERKVAGLPKSGLQASQGPVEVILGNLRWAMYEIKYQGKTTGVFYTSRYYILKNKDLSMVDVNFSGTEELFQKADSRAIEQFLASFKFGP